MVETATFSLMVGTALITALLVAPEKVIEGYKKGDFKRGIKKFFKDDFFGVKH